MPDSLSNFILSLPPVSVNNSRQIVRSLWETATRKFPKWQYSKGEGFRLCRFIDWKLGTNLGSELDYIPGQDDGVGPRGLIEHERI